jgi:alpha-glucoside transport system substrate-binding protein
MRERAVSGRTNWRRHAAAAAALALVATACLGQDADDSGGDAGGGAEGAGEGSADGESGTVTVLDAFTEPQDVAGFEALIAAFNEEYPDISVSREGSPSFEETALTRVEGGNPPDVIMHPQPGLLEDFIDRDAAQPLDFLDTTELEDRMVPGTLETGTFEDELYGLQVRLSLKSLVWYPQPAFDDAGYEVPETWDDMVALTEQIAGEGTTPWCIGVESGAATGWTATDWVEDIMLRLHGPDVYDDWVTNDLAFDSPEVTEAFEYVEEIWLNDEYVFGGTPSIIQTNFGDAPLPMFEDPPACFLHRQASFIQQSFPEDGEFGSDYDFFLLPEIDSEIGAPALTAGDLAALYTDNEAAKTFIEFMTTTAAQEAWAAEGSFLCSLTDCDTSAYPNEAFTQQGELLAEAPFARFDASDLMPGAVGAGTFWTETVAWVSGNQDLETTLGNIQSSWPSS